MASRQARRRHRRLLVPRAPASAETRWRRLGLAVAPGALYLTHLAAGANQTTMAQGLSLALALALCAMLTRPGVREELAELGFVWPLMGLFATVLGVALLTLYLPASPASASMWKLTGAPGVLTINRSATWLEIVKLGGLACIFAVGCAHGARGERARTTIEWIVLLGGVYAALSIAFFLAGLQVRGRLSGGFLSANSGATVFGMLAVITTAFLLRQLRRTARLDQGDRLRKLATPTGSLLFIAVCLVLTASRMGLAATGVSILILLTWDLASQRKIRITVRPRDLALAAAALAIVGAASIPMWTRVDELDSDATIRALIFSTHWRAFLASPVFGHGLGSFNDVNGQALTTENYSVLWSIRAAHNVYIQWLEEAGVAGALPMFALVAAITLISALHVSKMRSGKTLARGLVASSAVVLLHGTTDYALQVPSIAAFWAFLLGLQFAFTQWRS
jgi:O-antigen ligase